MDDELSSPQYINLTNSFGMLILPHSVCEVTPSSARVHPPGVGQRDAASDCDEQ